MIEYDQMVLRKDHLIAFKIAFLAILICFFVFLLVLNTKKFSVSHSVTTLVSSKRVITPLKELNSATTFANYLRDQGVIVEINDVINNPNFRTPGLAVTANGGRLTIYEYYSFDRVRGDANSIVKNCEALMASSQSPIHYFRKETLLVEYAGDDSSVLSILEKTLGPQFAGE